jgi:hypothetical protein
METAIDSILEKKEVMDLYSFVYEEAGMSKVICKCGARFEKEINYGERLTEAEAESLADMKELIMFSTHEKLKCPECETNFFIQDERARLISVGSYFMGGFSFKTWMGEGKLSFWRLKSYIDPVDASVKFIKQEKSIEVMPKEGEVWYEPFPWENKLALRHGKQLDLDNIVSAVEEFFAMDTVRTIYDIHELHMFLNWLGHVTQDASKMNIVGEILAPMRNRINDAGFDQIKRALCVFFCILKFPNLSTIALTKSIMFLSDLIMNCDMPSSNEMKESGSTAPLDIFNDLTGLYLKRIKNELSNDSNSVNEYVFRPSEHTPDIASDGKIVLTDKSAAIIQDKDIPDEAPKRINIKTDINQDMPSMAFVDSAFTTASTASHTTLNIRVRDQEKLDKMRTRRIAEAGRGERGGKSDVTSVIEDGTITKYIYDRLRTFADYARLVKFFKFYDKQELTDLMKKYEIDYLINFIEVAYWREKMDESEFYRLSKIIKDFIRIQTVGKRMFQENMNEVDEKDLDYSLMERFDFTIYDDSISMLESLRDLTSKADAKPADTDVDMFDRSRYFDKIRDYKKLKNFHDSLAAQYRLMESSGLEKDSSYHKFVSKYERLEENGDYDGPIEVQLLRTMSDFMKEGHIMMSSQAQYGAKVSQGIYLVARLLDHSKSDDPKEARRFTIGFTVDRFGFLEFDQLKEYKNAQASDTVKEHVRRWLEAKDITYDERTTDIRYRNR